MIKRIRTGVHYNGLISVLGFIGLAYGILLVRLVSQTEYAVFSLLLAASSLIGQLTSVGWPDAIQRYVPKLQQAGDKARLRTFVIKALGTRLLWAGGIILVINFFFDGLAPYFKLEGYNRHFQFFSLHILAFSQLNILFPTFHSLLRQKWLFYVKAFIRLLQGGILAIMFVWGTDIYGLLTFKMFETVVSTSILYVVLFRLLAVQRLGDLLWWRIDVETSANRKYRRFSYINQLGVSFLDTRIDEYIIAFSSVRVQVALYAVATRVASIISQITTQRMFGGAIQASFFRKYDKDQDISDLTQMFGFLAKANLTVLGGVFACAVPLAAPTFQWIFGDEYIASATIFLIFLGFLLVYDFPVGLVVKSVERMDLIVLSKVWSIFNLVIGVLFARYWGALGMAIATAASQALKTWSVFWMAKRVADLKVPWISFIRIGLNILVVTAVLWPLRHHAYINSINLALLAIGGSFLYFVLTVINSGYSRWEILTIRNLLPSRIRRYAIVNFLLAVMRDGLGRSRTAPSARR